MFNRFIQNFYNKTSNPLNNVGLPQKQLFEKLWDYYNNNGLYEGVQAQSYNQNKWLEALKPLRTPVNRSVEFYVSKMLSGDVTVSAQSKMAQEAIEQVWKWSNFDAQKQVLSKFLALTGNLFVKVVNDELKVWFENIPPSQVTNFKTDSRGYLTEIRIDIPITVDGKISPTQNIGINLKVITPFGNIIRLNQQNLSSWANPMIPVFWLNWGLILFR